MPKKSRKSTPDYMDVLSRRRWYLLIPLCLALIAGILLAVMLPKTYEASTLILIQPQRVPSDYIQSIVTTDINARIRTISQQIMSRTNLEKVIADFNLFSVPGDSGLLPEEKIGNLRGRISVNVTTPKGRRESADSFSISFRGRQPEKVMLVANALATYFIDTNLKAREAQAVGTSDFLEDELETMGMRLAGLEQQLKNYREANMGGLPEQLESNMRVLDRLQEQLNTTRQSLMDAKNRLALTERMISENQTIIAQEGQAAIETTTDPMRLREHLVRLQNRYTANHPDVIKLKKMIADLESSRGDSKENMSGEGDNANIKTITPQMLQRDQIKGEIRTLEAEISDLRAKTNHYQSLVENTPKKEQELLSLKRDYDNIRATYNSLLERKLEAQLAVNMEKKQKGEQFYILDSARIPEKPISPDMKKLFIMVLLAGVGGGIGLMYLSERMDRSFRSQEDVELTLGLPVISTVPVLPDRKDKMLQGLHGVATACFICVSIILLLGFSLVTFKGLDNTVRLVKEYLFI